MFDIVTLARIQLVMTTILHFFFVPFSIGLALVVAIMGTMYIMKREERYRRMAKFQGNIFPLSFAAGVVTGIIQEFRLGMNWSDYSRFVGDILGTLLAVGALLTFSLESTFLGLWIFTWDRIDPKVHVTFIWLVVFGSMASAFWILVANSLMQYPVDYVINNSRAEMVDFVAVISNPEAWYESSYVIMDAFMLDGMAIAGMAVFQLLKEQDISLHRASIHVGLWATLFGSIGVLLAGDLQMKALIGGQPMRFAATEGAHEDSGDPVAWTLIVWADEREHKQVFDIDIPYMLSILSYNELSGSVDGMDTVNKRLIEKYRDDKNYYSPVNTLFWSFRIVAGLGVLILLAAALGLFFTRKKKPSLYEKKWMLWIAALYTFTPFLVNTTGWLITELGRYPWTIYGLFTIEQSVSPNVSVASLVTSNVIYLLLFAGLGNVMIYLVILELRKGPNYGAKELAREGEPALDPFDKGVLGE